MIRFDVLGARPFLRLDVRGLAAVVGFGCVGRDELFPGGIEVAAECACRGEAGADYCGVHFALSAWRVRIGWMGFPGCVEMLMLWEFRGCREFLGMEEILRKGILTYDQSDISALAHAAALELLLLIKTMVRAIRTALKADALLEVISKS